MNKKKIKKPILIKNRMHLDIRGDFSRFFCEDISKKLYLKTRIVQVSVSNNLKKGTIRGLHFQKHPYTEDKYVSCIKGKLFDVIVDLRKNSKNYLKTYYNLMTDKNKNTLFIPKGFAHGFQTLVDNTIIIYGMTKPYKKRFQAGVNYNDPKLNIPWPLSKIIISNKDKKLKYIK